MREAIGSYFLTGIVITFIVLFTGYLCLSINMNKSYKVKNEIINIIQKRNGLDEEALIEIQNYMSSVGYRTEGNCDSGDDNNWRGANVSGSTLNDTRGAFCVRTIKSEEYRDSDYSKEQFPESVYYQVKVFFAIDLPIVRNLFTFTTMGSTKRLYYPCTNYGGGECL